MWFCQSTNWRRVSQPSAIDSAKPLCRSAFPLTLPTGANRHRGSGVRHTYRKVGALTGLGKVLKELDRSRKGSYEKPLIRNAGIIGDFELSMKQLEHVDMRKCWCNWKNPGGWPISSALRDETTTCTVMALGSCKRVYSARIMWIILNSNSIYKSQNLINRVFGEGEKQKTPLR